MSKQPAGFQLLGDHQGQTSLMLSGDWVQGQDPGQFTSFESELSLQHPTRLTADGSSLGDWDSILMAFLLQCYNHCREEGIEFVTRDMPASVEKLLEVATAVATHQPPVAPGRTWRENLNPLHILRNVADDLTESLAFLGEVTIALARLLAGKANTRFSDFQNFCYQAGPDAFAIISLTSVLVGMILAYLGAVQLQQFGAAIYVADLVAIGMLREMGVLMTAVVMAGRTGAAYAAQLGTMQTNE